MFADDLPHDAPRAEGESDDEEDTARQHRRLKQRLHDEQQYQIELRQRLKPRPSTKEMQQVMRDAIARKHQIIENGKEYQRQQDLLQRRKLEQEIPRPAPPPPAATTITPAVRRVSRQPRDGSLSPLFADSDDEDDPFPFVVRELNKPAPPPAPFVPRRNQPPKPPVVIGDDDDDDDDNGNEPLPPKPGPINYNYEPASPLYPGTLEVVNNFEEDNDDGDVNDNNDGKGKRRRLEESRDDPDAAPGSRTPPSELAERARAKAANENRLRKSTDETSSAVIASAELSHAFAATVARTMQFSRSLLVLLTIESHLRSSTIENGPRFFFLVAEGSIGDANGRFTQVETMLRVEALSRSVRWSDMGSADEVNDGADLVAQRMPTLMCRFRFDESQPENGGVRSPPPFDTMPWPITVERTVGDGKEVIIVDNPTRIMRGDVFVCESRYVSGFNVFGLSPASRTTRDITAIEKCKNILLPLQNDANRAIVGTTRTPFGLLWLSINTTRYPARDGRAFAALNERQ